MTSKERLSVVVTIFKEDPELFYIFKKNIVMAYREAAWREKSEDSFTKIQYISDLALKTFLNWTFGKDLDDQED